MAASRLKSTVRILRNVVLVAYGMLKHGIPPYKAKQVWQAVQEAHRQDVHKLVWEAKKQGLVWEDKEGRLWSTKTHPKPNDS